jgi:hypothetical protein
MICYVEGAVEGFTTMDVPVRVFDYLREVHDSTIHEDDQEHLRHYSRFQPNAVAVSQCCFRGQWSASAE